MTVLLAVSLGLLIGLSLGALGGGGSVLTVPALVYGLGETAQSATTGSLVIVGVTAAAATVGHARAGRVRWRAGSAFGAAGVAASLVGTHLNARVQPEVLLVAFAVLMLIAAAAMLVKTMVASSPDDAAADERAAALRRPGGTGTVVPARPSPAELRTGVRNVLPVLAAGLVVGFLTGFLGVGGGFIIVPALVLTLEYEMPTAVGTSLVIISLNSVVALLARGGQDSFHWAVIVPFTCAAIAGSSAGKTVAPRQWPAPHPRLRRPAPRRRRLRPAAERTRRHVAQQRSSPGGSGSRGTSNGCHSCRGCHGDPAAGGRPARGFAGSGRPRSPPPSPDRGHSLTDRRAVRRPAGRFAPRWGERPGMPARPHGRTAY